MAVKEYREFFLRNIKVFTGSKKDQESGYVVKYLVKGISRFNRFLKGHYPSQGVFEKLFASIAFKLNPEDSASTTEQGLVQTATDTQAKAGSNGSGFPLHTKPSHLPTVVEDVNSAETGITITTIANTPTQVAKVTVDGAITTRNKYVVTVYQGFMTYLKNSFNAIKTYIDSVTITINSFSVVNDGTGSVFTRSITAATGTATKQFAIDLKVDLYGLAVPTGAMLDFPVATPPAGWLLCDGSSILRAGVNAPLFALVGTTFGSVDGTHFTLPDFRKRVSLGYDAAASASPGDNGVGQENYGAIGNTGGIKDMTILLGNIPKHTHTQGTLVTAGAGSHNHTVAMKDDDDSTDDDSSYPETGNAGGADESAITSTQANHTHAISGTTEDGTDAGLGSTATQNRQPYIVMAKIIKI